MKAIVARTIFGAIVGGAALAALSGAAGASGADPAYLRRFKANYPPYGSGSRGGVYNPCAVPHWVNLDHARGLILDPLGQNRADHQEYNRRMRASRNSSLGTRRAAAPGQDRTVRQWRQTRTMLRGLDTNASLGSVLPRTGVVLGERKEQLVLGPKGLEIRKLQGEPGGYQLVETRRARLGRFGRGSMRLTANAWGHLTPERIQDAIEDSLAKTVAGKGRF